MKKRFQACIGIGIVCLLAFAFRHFVIHVVTPSIPMGWYFVQRWGQPRRGEYIVICPPAQVTRIGKARGYLIPGDCPGNVSPLVKRLAAMEGDTVTLSEHAFSVNGKRIADGPQRYDSLGRPLESLARRTYHVDSDAMWLLGDARQSWDSRYFGPFARHTIIGRAVPILTQALSPDTNRTIIPGDSHE
jgi:conjugative transfer signal peptidase TraF